MSNKMFHSHTRTHTHTHTQLDNNRYFVLNEEKGMNYYVSDQRLKHKGKINLKNCNRMTRTDEQSITIETPSRTWFMYTVYTHTPTYTHTYTHTHTTGIYGVMFEKKQMNGTQPYNNT